MVVVALQTAPVAAQIVLPTPTEPVAVDRTASEGELAVSLDRIRRALDSSAEAGAPRLRIPDVREYLFVVGKAPEVSLFGDTDLSRGAGAVGAPTHADMRAIARPSRLDQAIGSDALGVATTALSMVVPRAIRAVAGWFSGDQDDRVPRWVGYTGTFVLEPTDEASPTAHALLFHRLDGHRVSLHTSASHPPNAGVVITVDGQEWGALEQEVADRTIPNELRRSRPSTRRGRSRSARTASGSTSTSTSCWASRSSTSRSGRWWRRRTMG